MLSSDGGMASASQVARYIIMRVKSDVREFARLVAGISDSRRFDDVIRNVVPSLFGFFSTDEDLSVAEKFYVSLRAFRPRDVGRFLAPLMSLGGTFRFVESVFAEFLHDFSIDVHYWKAHTVAGRRKQLVGKLGRTIIKYLRLLPVQILNILEDCVKHVDRRECRDFFMRTFLKQFAVKFLAMTPARNYSRNLEELFDDLVSNDSCDITDAIFAAIPTTQRAFKVPCKGCGRHSNYLVSVRDMKVLSELLVQGDMLPQIPNKRYFIEAADSLASNVLWATTAAEEVKVRECESLFGLESDNEIDRYIEERRQLKEMMAYEEAIRAYGRLFSAEGRKMVESKSERMSDLLRNGLEKTEHLVKHLSAAFAGIDKDVKETLQRSLPETERLLSSMPDTNRAVVDDAAEMLSCIDQVDDKDRFPIIIDALDKMYVVGQKMGGMGTLFEACVMKYKGDQIASTVLKLDAVVMKRQFMELCSEKEHILWLSLQNAIFECIRQQTKLLDRFLLAQSSLMGGRRRADLINFSVDLITDPHL